VGIPFLLLSAALGATALGWLRRRFLGWRLAVFIITAQVLGDLFNLFRGHFLEGSAGVVIAGALLLYLLQANLKSFFLAQPSPLRPECGSPEI